MPILAKSNAGATSGALIASKEVNIEDLHTAEPFKSAFEIDEKTLNEVTESIKKNGFYKEEPIVVWKEEDKIVDGHTRLQAAIKAGISAVPVHYKSFESEEQALLYTFERQEKRRQTTDSQLLNVALRLNLDSKNEYGTGSKADVLSGTFNISERKAKQTIKVAKDPVKSQEVLSGEKTIRSAYNEIQQKEKEKINENSEVSEVESTIENDSMNIFEESSLEISEPVTEKEEIFISDKKTAAQIITLLLDFGFTEAAKMIFKKMPEGISDYISESNLGILN